MKKLLKQKNFVTGFVILLTLLLVAFIALVVWLAPKVWRGMKRVFGKIKSWFSKTDSVDTTPAATELDNTTKRIDSG